MRCFLGLAFMLLQTPLLANEGFRPGDQDYQLVDAGVESLKFQIRRNSTLYQSLRELGLSSKEVHNVVVAARKHLDLSKIMAGTELKLYYAKYPLGALVEIEFDLGPLKSFQILRESDDSWTPRYVETKADVRWVSFTGYVSSSLWESAQVAGMDPNLIVALAEIFAWQVDFSREVQKGDAWRILVEQLHVGDKVVGWGSILAADYRNQSKIHSAILLRDPETQESLGYFAPDGKSLKQMFLRAPMKFGRISSRFSMKRFHPILKFSRPHIGVDYAAPIGTPVLAVGDGVVSKAAWMGGGGKTIQIRHNSVYQTYYKHLHGFARGIRVGARVRQGQVIGYVGTTGLSTGPHLHYELWENGRYVDPLGKKFPSADPVPSRHMKTFRKSVEFFTKYLPAWVQNDTEAPRGPMLVSSGVNF
jgi:murein DD-endopeptidase MepM/ murein hydrolase activator NlpD